MFDCGVVAVEDDVVFAEFVEPWNRAVSKMKSNITHIFLSKITFSVFYTWFGEMAKFKMTS